jgi:hypothetical protein
MTAHGRLLFIFLDGVGIGEEDGGRNPWVRAVLPTLQELTGGRIPTVRHPVHRTSRSAVFPLDATLGVDGIPQSGTGQAALLTGRNAPRIFGRHFGPWTPVALRPLVEEHSLLRVARDAGRRVAFANAYPRGWPGSNGSRRVAGPPLAARGAGVLDRHEEALARGDAVSSEMVNDGWRRQMGHADLPDVTEEEAGRNLARIADAADLTLYAHYATDTAGHRAGMEGAVAALERVDRFLKGVLDVLTAHVTVLVASDHGNIEDVTAQHTRNPALGLTAGPGAAKLADRLRTLLDVTPVALEHLGVRG